MASQIRRRSNTEPTKQSHRSARPKLQKPKLIENLLRKQNGVYSTPPQSLSSSPMIYPAPALLPANPPAVVPQAKMTAKSRLLSPLNLLDLNVQVMHNQPSVDLPHIYQQPKSEWRLAPLEYHPGSPPNNPGLLALSRSGHGGVFAVHNTFKDRTYAMEILHLPSLGRKDYLRAMKKLRILRKIREHPRTSQFVLQASLDSEPSIWWSDYLYLHIVTEYCPETLQNRCGDHELVGNEPVLGHIIWELLEGLSYLNSLDIIHANLMPGNVLINTQGHCVITGFGVSYVAKRQQRPLRIVLDSTKKDLDSPIVTPGWSAPEFWPSESGIFDFSETVDSWSLGLIICFLLVPRVFHAMRKYTDPSINRLQHYKDSRLTPDDISLQMWIACSPYTVTEFVSMMCQLESADRLDVNDAQVIAKRNGWDKRLGAPFQIRNHYPVREQPVPRAHRKLTAKQKASFGAVTERKLKFSGGDIPKSDDAFVPNLHFEPF